MPKKVFFIVSLLLLYIYPQTAFAANITINEFSAHPSSGNDEWVEIYNPDNTDLTNYFIDDDTSFVDDAGGSSKKQLTTITSGMYAVFTLSSSMFNNAGDNVVLFDNSGNIIDQFEYTSDPGMDVAIGRSPDATGGFELLVNATKGSMNSGVLPTATFTPTEIPTPTRIPTPTHSASSGQAKVPTPTHAGSSGQVKSSTSTPTITMPTKSNALSSLVHPTKKTSSQKTAKMSPYPTVVLGASTSARKASDSAKKSDVLVKDAQQNNSLTGFAIIVGSLLFIGASGYIFWKTKQRGGF